MRKPIRPKLDYKRVRDLMRHAPTLMACAVASAAFSAGAALAANSAVSEAVALTARPFASNVSAGGALYSTECVGTIIMVR